MPRGFDINKSNIDLIGNQQQNINRGKKIWKLN